MTLYYLANSIYQFAYALPLFQKLGGIFVTPNKKKHKHFLQFLQTASIHFDEAPKVIVVPRTETHQLRGVLLFLANTIQIDKDYKQAITIFHEHGTSDKKYEGGDAIAIQKLSKYDYIFLSGPKNLERLNDIDINIPDEKLIEIGCLRFDDFLNGRFNREEETQKLKIRDTSRKNLLYAPTWKFGSGTLRKYGNRIIDETTQHFNLILRPHYHDRKYAYFLFWMKKLSGKKNVYFSFPQDIHRHDTYAAFAVSDLLISDISSVIYEYLITTNPIIVVENDFKERHRMPAHLDILRNANIYKQGESLKNLIQYCFADSSAIRARMCKMLNNCFYAANGGAVKNAESFLKKYISDE